MALTADQLKTLSARAVVDPEFRTFLLAKPKEAAKQLGMKLSKKDEAQILENAERIQADGKRADKALQREKYILIFAFSAPTGKGGIKKEIAAAPKKKPTPMPKKTGNK